MSMFWIIAISMIALAIVFIVRPLVRPSHSAGLWSAFAAAVVLPAIAVSWYLKFGAGADALSEKSSPHPEVHPSQIAQKNVGSVASMIVKLELRLESNPGDAEGWVLLARSYDHIGQREQADAAYDRAAQLGIDTAKLLAARPAPTGAQSNTVPSASSAPHDMEDAITNLLSRLDADPGDAEAWVMLGRSYQSLSRYAEAAEAFQKATHLQDGDARLWADYADALAMANGKQLQGRPTEALRNALQRDPNNRKALWLAGTAAMQRGDFQDSLKHWTKLQELTSLESSDARIIAANIEEIRTKLEQGSVAASNADAMPSVAIELPADTSTPEIRGVVSIDAGLADKIADNDTVFIFARAAEGPRIPLAVLRKQAKDLPISFVLNDGMAMTPAFKLSKFSDVVVGARISKSGNATPQPGDFTGTSEVINVTTKDSVTLVIKTQES